MTKHSHKISGAMKMARILEMRYLHEMTLEQVGHALGITRERVRQLEGKAIRILRHNPRLREKALDILREIDEARGTPTTPFL